MSLLQHRASSAIRPSAHQFRVRAAAAESTRLQVVREACPTPAERNMLARTTQRAVYALRARQIPLTRSAVFMLAGPPALMGAKGMPKARLQATTGRGLNRECDRENKRVRVALRSRIPGTGNFAPPL